MLRQLRQTCSLLLYRVCVLVFRGGGYRGRGCGMLKLSTHRAMQQLANKDEFCFVWQRFSVHYFPLCPVRIPALSSCLSCKDTLSGPDSSSPAHTHSVCMAHAHFTCAHTPPPPHTHTPAYVGNICSDLSHYHSIQHNSSHVAFSSPPVLSFLIFCQISLPILLSFP